MIPSAEGLKARVEDILEVLNEPDSLLSLDQEGRTLLLHKASDLLERIGDVEARSLTVGLLGGTGVGKSTLMNALAGREIASASHRRPHTDRILLYRWREGGPLPDLALEGLPWEEFLHDAREIRHILLCDLPDFDSLAGQNQGIVWAFLKSLDLLVFVTSPEKYADNRFYAFLEATPKARRNFLFVLNKMDTLFEGRSPEKGYQDLVRVTDTFRAHLRERKLDDPALYVLSAKEPARESASDAHAPWNQFPLFRQHLFQQRDQKQILAIKTGNLIAEFRVLCSPLEQEARLLKGMALSLQRIVEDLQGRLEEWNRRGREAMDLWLGADPFGGTPPGLPESSPLLGPGAMLANLVEAFQKNLLKTSPDASSAGQLRPPKEVEIRFRHALEWARNRVIRGVLIQNPGQAFQERLESLLHVDRRFEETGDRFYEVISGALAGYRPSALRGFKSIQFLTYLLLLLFLILALGGEAARQALIDGPGLPGLVQISLSAIGTLFSSKGLAALLTYGLLNLFFAVRFYTRYRKMLRRRSQRLLGKIRTGLERAWTEAFHVLLMDLEKMKGDIEARMNRLPSQEGGFKGKGSGSMPE